LRAEAAADFLLEKKLIITIIRPDKDGRLFLPETSRLLEEA
jgi:hypothetical protein